MIPPLQPIETAEQHATLEDALVQRRSQRVDEPFWRMRGCRLTALLFLTLPILIAANTACGATITVTSSGDSGGTCPGPSCTLRQAISTAASGDTIAFGATIAVIDVTGTLAINKTLTITGHPDGNPLTIRRNDSLPTFGILNIASSTNVTISGLTITGGEYAMGGGIANNGTLTLIGCTVSGNVGNNGGGIYNSDGATLTIINSSVSSNEGCGNCGYGGGINNSSGATVTIVNTTISNTFYGGGVYNAGTATITNSTIANNDSCCITPAGGVANASGATLSAGNTIIAGSSQGFAPDVSGTVNSLGYNLIQNIGSATITGNTQGNKLGIDPMLGPLQDNGGLSFTQGLLDGSPAIDAGISSGSSTDQRGFPRPIDFAGIPNASGGDGSDIGGFEVQTSLPPAQISVSSSPQSSIAEFVIQGAIAKEIAVQNPGPVLSLYNINGALIATNDQNLPITAILSAGTYVAALSSEDGDPVMGPLEIQDLRLPNSVITATGTRGKAPLTNVLTISGGGTLTIVARALGPSLGSYGILDGLANPRLTLQDAYGSTLAFNDDWMDDPNAATIQSLGLAPIGDLESAFMVTLDPGDYTLDVEGYNSSTGTAFVDAYALPYSGVPLNPVPDLTPPPTPTPTPTPVNPGESVNISTRARVDVDEGVSIGGFIITGAGSKQVLVRAIGPSLANASLADVLADPILQLHGANGVTLLTNDNWKDDANQAAEIQATGIPPPDDLESALVTTLSVGAYTAVVSGKSSTAGLALVEVYDLEGGNGAQLANISTRCLIKTGDDVAIGGFILGAGAGSSSIVVRGIGPSLSQQGVTDALADPTLELHDGNGTLLQLDDDWQDDPIQASEISGTGLAPTSSFEAAIFAVLPPGNYTAIVSGKNAGVGVGLVEIYNLN